MILSANIFDLNNFENENLTEINFQKCYFLISTK